MNDRQTGKKKGGAGCAIFVVVGIALLVAGLLAAGVMVLFWTRTAVVEGHEQLAHAEVALMESKAPMAADGQDGQDTVMISRKSLADLAGADFGSELSREHFIAVMVDDHATDLMRKRFNEKASGLQVTWRLRVEDVQAPDSNGNIQASCSLPYTVHQPNSRMSSSISLRVEFPPGAAEDLMRVRRGQWLTVTGELALDDRNRNARIKAARVAKEAG